MTEKKDLRDRETDPPPAPTAPDHAKPSGLETILSAGREKPPVTESVTAPSDGLRTPDEHCSDLKVPAWLHAMARQLHGWHEHEHHAGSPMRISRAAYTDALAAANGTKPERQGKPSLNATSPHRGKGL